MATCSEFECEAPAVATLRAIKRELVAHVCRRHLGYMVAVVDCAPASISCRHCLAGVHGICPVGVWCLCRECVDP